MSPSTACLFPKLTPQAWKVLFKKAEFYTKQAHKALLEKTTFSKFCKLLPNHPPICVTWSMSSIDSAYKFTPASNANVSIFIGVKNDIDKGTKALASSLIHEIIHYGQHMSDPFQFHKLCSICKRSYKAGYLSHPLELEANAIAFSYLYGKLEVYKLNGTSVKDLVTTWATIAKYHTLPAYSR